MRQSIIYTSENKNCYLYNDKHRFSMIVHPALKQICETEKCDYVDSYYVRKYMYLKKHDFFSNMDYIDINTEISEAKVKEALSHTPQILFEVTESCNLNCVYCALGSVYEWGKNRKGKKLDINSALSLLRYIWGLKLSNKDTELVISFYGGEPLLNIKFIKTIVDFVCNLNHAGVVNVSYSMTTNAVLLDKYIDYLVANRFHILVSLDGNEENNSYRIYQKNGRNSFRKIVENLDFVKEKFPNFFETNVDFNAVLHNRNSVKSIYEFFHGRYHKIPRVSEMNRGGIVEEKNDLFQKMFRDIRDSEKEYYKEKDNLLLHEDLLPFHELSNFLKYFSINSYVSDILSTLCVENKYFPASTCFPFSKKIFLTTHGQLMPCERIDYKYSLGEVDEGVFLNVSQIVQQYNAYYKCLEKYCRHCYLYRFCGLCMFHLENLKKEGTEKMVCHYFHNQKNFQFKLSRIFSFLEKHPNDFFKILEDIISCHSEAGKED